VTIGRLVEGYGLSEATPVTHANPVFGEDRIGTIGLPLPHTEAKIVDIETGMRELPPGEAGELILRGPQVMKGYWRIPTETSNVLRDGWLYTGDIARMDQDGYFEIVERKQHLILGAGGHNVYPREIEAVLSQHSNVSACAVVGIPAVGKGERVTAFVVLRAGESAEEVDAADIIEFCREALWRLAEAGPIQGAQGHRVPGGTAHDDDWEGHAARTDRLTERTYRSTAAARAEQREQWVGREFPSPTRRGIEGGFS